jgi:hypothetical protein
MGNVNSDEYWGSQIPRVENHGADHRLTIRGIKLFTDGKRAVIPILSPNRC